VKPLLPTHEYLRRVLASVAWGLALVVISLAAGMLGYHILEGRPWIDAFLNASMILSGMGPLWDPQSAGGKIFAGLYALYSGLAVLIIAGVILAPAVHRFLHRFHLEAERDGADDDR
jgi:hypothetical protein